jgi:hypothetical protein
MKTFLIETLTLIFLPFITFPSDYRLLYIREMKYYPVRGRYMMWCGWLIHHGDIEQWYGDKYEWLHKNIHLMQARTHFLSWPGFYISYLWETFTGFLVCGAWLEGIRMNKYEMEAQSNKEDIYYVSEYKSTNLNKYKMKLEDKAQNSRKERQ